MKSRTLNTKVTRLARAAMQARALAVPLVAAGALAAGCGTAHAPVSGGTPGSAATQASVSPVPTVTGGAVVAGEPACAGWPASAPRATMSPSFDPVAVERCVTGFQLGPGKVEWQTATLEKATGNLTALVAALLRPATAREPGTVCPYLVMLPPQVVLISSTGKQLIPRLPLSNCGMVESQVITALATLTWQPVSVRLVGGVGAEPNPATRPSSFKTIQTLPASLADQHKILKKFLEKLLAADGSIPHGCGGRGYRQAPHPAGRAPVPAGAAPASGMLESGARKRAAELADGAGMEAAELSSRPRRAQVPDRRGRGDHHTPEHPTPR